MRPAAARSPARWWPAAVVFPCGWLETGLDRKLRGLNDSKQLTEAQREKYLLHPHLASRHSLRDCERGRGDD